MDAKGSGTDADVYLTVFGEFGDTGQITTEYFSVCFYDAVHTKALLFSAFLRFCVIFRRT